MNNYNSIATNTFTTIISKLLVKIMFFLCIYNFTNCSYKKIDADKSIKKTTTDSLIQKTTLKVKKHTFPLIIEEPEKCNCNSNFSKIHPQLKFNGYNFHLDSLTKWTPNKALKIKSLEFRYFDTIPKEFKIFKNVEFLVIGYIDWDLINGLEIFPKLKGLELLGKTIDVSSNPSWLKNIEILHASKTHLIGLESFKSMPNLKEIDFGYGKFSPFPSDFNSLKCLISFKLGAVQGIIDLNPFDLNQTPCLETLDLLSWGGLKGLPKGIENIKNLSIKHPNLTKEEKDKLNAIKK